MENILKYISPHLLKNAPEEILKVYMLKQFLENLKGFTGINDPYEIPKIQI